VDALLGRPFTQLRVKGFGAFTIRPGTSDCRVVREILGNGEYDLSFYPQHTAIETEYARIVDAGRTPLIVDLGANIGAASRWYALRYPRAHIVAVEPDRSNAELCRRNTAGQDVGVITAAVGSTPGFVSVSDDSDEKWAITTTRDDRGGIPICLVNDIVRSVPDAELFIVKVDIEGFEADLFSANTEWVQQAAVVIIEPHDWLMPGGATSRSFQQVFGALDHDVLIRGENLVYVRRAPGVAGSGTLTRPWAMAVGAA
jgi:FkbM family methyltransferase